MKAIEPRAGDAGEQVLDARARRQLASLRYPVYVITLILVAASLYFARAFFIPVVLAFLLALLLSPIVRAGQRRGITHVASASILVTLVGVVMIAGLFVISAPAARWIEQTPQIATQLEFRLRGIREPMNAMTRASERVEQATETGEHQQTVVMDQQSILSRVVDNVVLFFATVVLSLLLTAFMLSSSDLFYSKIVELSPTFSAKKGALTMIRGVERRVSHYLLTVTVINCMLGVAIGFAMWGVGMPTPYLWGVAAALLNFMPYVGMLLGAFLVGAVAIVSFDSVTYAALAPLVYLTFSSIEGGVITPIVLGRRFSINTVAIFLAIAFWGWLWGVVGILVAVPLLVVTKVVCEHVPGMRAIGELLSAERGIRSANAASDNRDDGSDMARAAPANLPENSGILG